MGRPKKNTELKILRGTFRKHREAPAPEIFEPMQKLPPPPAGMGKAGRDLWKTLGGELFAAGVLTGPDMPAFTMLCESTDRADRLHGALTNNGKRTLAAGIEENPAWYRALKFEKEFCSKLFESFGASPRSRTSVSAKKTTKEDPDVLRMRELLAGGF